MTVKVVEVKVLIIVTDVPIQVIVAILQSFNVQDQRSVTDHSSCGVCLKDRNSLR
jgi:hypothetical protein